MCVSDYNLNLQIKPLETESFPTLIYQLPVIEGKWYYEFSLEEATYAQIGWTYVSDFKNNEGVGDDNLSWGYDGKRLKKWNGDKSGTYGNVSNDERITTSYGRCGDAEMSLDAWPT